MNTKDKAATLESLLDSIDADVLSPNVSDDEIADELRVVGGDPDAIGARGASLAQALLAERNLSQRVGRAALRTSKGAMSPRRQLLLSEVEGGKADGRFAEYLEKTGFSPESASDEELWEVLRKLRELRKIPPSSD